MLVTVVADELGSSCSRRWVGTFHRSPPLRPSDGDDWELRPFPRSKAISSEVRGATLALEVILAGLLVIELRRSWVHGVLASKPSSKPAARLERSLRALVDLGSKAASSPTPVLECAVLEGGKLQRTEERW